MGAEDARIKQDGARWFTGTAKVERVIALEDGRVLLKSSKNPAPGREMILHGAELAAGYEVRTADGAGNVSAKVAAIGPDAKPAKVFDDAPDQGFTYIGEWKHQTNLLPAHEGTILGPHDPRSKGDSVAIDGFRVER